MARLCLHTCWLQVQKVKQGAVHNHTSTDWVSCVMGWLGVRSGSSRLAAAAAEL